jgi:transcription-repair coupling factor (superfamily II helicase)
VRSRRWPTCGAGDFVVHEDHGVGRFVRFDTKEVGGVVRDYLYLEFRGDDRLYVPHEQLAKVSRYVGSDGSRAGARRSSAASVAER